MPENTSLVQTSRSSVEPCCGWCRRPVRLCHESACDDAPIYTGLPTPTGLWSPLGGEAEPFTLEYDPPALQAA
jgi:hypothetical protein